MNYPGCTSILGNVIIGDPDGTEITDLSGLSVLTSVGGSLTIGGNHDLVNLSGLENLSEIQGNLHLDILDDDPYSVEWIGNYNLANMEALNNLTMLGGNLEIINNPDLTFCDLAWICDYLEDPPSVVNIHSNGSNCGSVVEFAVGCGESLPCLPFGHYWLCSQEDIDSFSAVFPGCTDLIGDLTISGDNSIVSLDGLSGLNSVGRDLSFFVVYGLNSLSGLENLVSVGRHLNIEGGIYPDLTGLNNISHINGGLTICFNDSLTSLNGLDNLPGESISSLLIMYNPNLSTCHVISICEYLASPNGYLYIQDNAPGCNYQSEVMEACISGINDDQHPDFCSVYPNPSGNQFTFSFTLEQPSIVKLEVINQTGQIVEVITNGFLRQGDYNLTWQPQGIPSGIYFYRLTKNSQTSKGKLVVRY